MVRRQGERGTALMEVMLAAAVLGAAMCALTHAMSAALNAQGRAEEHAEVASLMDTMLLKLRTGMLDVSPGESQGRFPEPYDGYTWLYRVEGPNDEMPFARLTLEIRKGEKAGVYRFQTLLAGA